MKARAASLLWALGSAPALALPPLTDIPGDAARGFTLLVSSGTEGGNCLVCHGLTDARLPEGFSGDVGPSLDGVASRLSTEEIRQQIVDPNVLNPQSVMPGYFITEGLTNVGESYRGKPYLSAQEIEDITAYLETLK